MIICLVIDIIMCKDQKDYYDDDNHHHRNNPFDLYT